MKVNYVIMSTLQEDLQGVLEELSPEGIQDFIVLQEVMKPYLSDGESFCMQDMVSPVPRKYRFKGKPDTNASFGFYVSDHSKRVRWVDHGMLKQENQGVVDLMILLVRDIATISEAYKLYQEILRGTKVDIKQLVKAAQGARKEVPEVEYDKEYRPWEIRVWDDVWVTPQMMSFMEIYGLRRAEWINGHAIFSSEQTPRFLYLFDSKDQDLKFKLYSPLEPKGPRKFKAYNSNNIEGWPVLVKYLHHRKPKDLWITSSTKDMAVSMAATGWLWLATAGEKNMKGWKARIDDIRRLGLNLHWVYDGDDVGWENSKRMAKEFGGKAYDLRGKLGHQFSRDTMQLIPIKDQSDFVSKKGLKSETEPLNNTLADLKKVLEDLV